MSHEGVTQGDPLAMAFYALATIPLIEKLKQNVLQVWYADDATGAGKICSLRSWWDKIRDLGPAFGYFPNATKSHLLVKPRLLSEARDIFMDTNISIITEGKEYLGGAVGSHQFMKEFVHLRVQKWKSNVNALSEIAKIHPQAALSVLTRGLSSKWTYLMRVTNAGEDIWTPLEEAL